MKLRVHVEGKSYEVEVEILDDGGLARGMSRSPASLTAASPAAVAIPAPAVAVPSAAPANSAANGEKAFPSPIPGTVLRIAVQVGQTVKPGDELLVLEAMKMESVIASHCDGKIAKIHVSVGDAVQSQQALVEFE